MERVSLHSEGGEADTQSLASCAHLSHFLKWHFPTLPLSSGCSSFISLLPNLLEWMQDSEMLLAGNTPGNFLKVASCLILRLLRSPLQKCIPVILLVYFLPTPPQHSMLGKQLIWSNSMSQRRKQSQRIWFIWGWHRHPSMEQEGQGTRSLHVRRSLYPLSGLPQPNLFSTTECRRGGRLVYRKVQHCPEKGWVPGEEEGWQQKRFISLLVLFRLR